MQPTDGYYWHQKEAMWVNLSAADLKYTKPKIKDRGDSLFALKEIYHLKNTV
jgi:hypothetical protein